MKLLAEKVVDQVLLLLLQGAGAGRCTTVKQTTMMNSRSARERSWL